jgi:hypothetical protein
MKEPKLYTCPLCKVQLYLRAFREHMTRHYVAGDLDDDE